MFTIKLNGEVYATFSTKLRLPTKVVSAYQKRMISIGYSIPNGEWTASRYIKNSLDNYGN